MRGPVGVLEEAWLWTYTAGLPPQDGDDRRAEIRSDHWEYEHAGGSRTGFERVARLTGGVADDIAWRASFGRTGLNRARAHEAVLVAALAGFFFVTLPASTWWAVVLAGSPDGPGMHIWYIASTALSLACAVVGGAASAAHYPRTGRALMLAGSLGITATLWWTPVAFIVGLAGVAAVLALPRRGPLPTLRNLQDIL